MAANVFAGSLEATLAPVNGLPGDDDEQTKLPASQPDPELTMLGGTPVAGAASSEIQDAGTVILPHSPSAPSNDDVTRYEPVPPVVVDDDVTRYQPASAPITGGGGGQRRDSSLRGSLDRLRSAGESSSGQAGEGAPAKADRGSAAQGPIEVGMPFGSRYHIIRVLGIGGMGAVYQAWDAELGVAVAIKVIRPEIAADPVASAEIERRFKRELLLARQVTHPNVVRIHDLGEINGIKYITMPYVEGSDLATILKEETKLPLPRALHVARGVVSGLVSAHAADVVHRDLKPANIMIGPGDEPMLMDFGIARSAGGPGNAPPPGPMMRPADFSRTAAAAASSTMAGAIVGTVAYMAPEQARGAAVDQRADIYAFGLIMYDMLVGGRRSDKALSAVEELQARMVTAPPPPRTIDPQIPETVDAIVRRCLEPDPANRFQTTVELQTALARLDDNGKTIPIMRRISRRGMVAAAVVMGLLLGGTYFVAKKLSVPDAPHDPVSVVIADFQNNTSDPSFDRTLEQTLRRGLEGASFISAYDRSRIRVGLGVQPPPKLDEVAARELAVKQGLGIVLSGSIASRGSGYEISIKAAHAVTGDAITTTTARASSKDEVLAAAAKLMVTVRKDLGDRTSKSDQLFAMRSLSASSLAVVSEYAAAVEAQAKGNFEEARQRYLKAVELDPQFGLGYQGLAAMSRNLGRLDEADKYIKEAFRYVDGMTERERFATRGYYYRTIGDNQQCAKEYSDLLTRFPGDTVAHNQRAGCLFKLREMREAGEEMQQAVQLLPNHTGYRTNLALFAALSGSFEAAEAELKQLPQPTNASVPDPGVQPDGSWTTPGGSGDLSEARRHGGARRLLCRVGAR